MRYVRKCKCCCEDEQLKDLWSEYVCDGQTENYGEMINECFSLAWEEPEEEDSEFICEPCVERLRYALEFRREIMTAQDAWADFLESESETENKIPMLIVKDEGEEQRDEESAITEELESDREQGTNKYEYEVTMHRNQDVTIPDPDIILQDQNTDNENDVIVKYEEEVDENDEQYVEADSSQDEEYEPENDESIVEQYEVEYLEDDDGAPIAKKARQCTSYKQYTHKDMEAALDKVMNNVLTRSDAARIYNIPVKTLGARIRALEKDEAENPPTAASFKKNLTFYEEIRMILTYTNATPYKTKIGKFFCAYCGSEGPVFHNTDLLRVHTRTEHADERIVKVEPFMKPMYLNEILKVDILNLHCTVCVIKLNDWNTMFQHLLDVHDVTFDQAYTRVIPYTLTEDLPCALCDMKFSHFHMLDVHMNCHYNNYICGECGDSFLSETRLKKHVETHSTKQFPCEECGKIFSLDKYRRKHKIFVHQRISKFKCHYCEEYFKGEYQRHLHQIKVHVEKIKQIICENCNATFTWRPYYLKHVRLQHNQQEKKHECKLCSKKFMQKHELKHHLMWHKGEGFTCPLCDKKFSTKGYVQKHLAIKHPDSEHTSVYVLVNENEEILG